MVQETGVQSQVESYQRLKKWCLMPPHLTLSIIRYGSWLKWSNLDNGSARGVMVIVAGIGHGDTSSNPGLIAFHIALIPLGKV